MKSDSRHLTSWLFLLSLAGSAGLIIMGVFFILDNVEASRLFGVSLEAGPGTVYVTVAGVRDLSVGALALVFTLLRDRRAVGLTVLLGAIIPIGDGFVVLAHGSAPLRFLPLHWGGAIGCVVFALVLLLPLRADTRSREL